MNKEEFIKSIRIAVENALAHNQPDMNIVQAFLLLEILDKLDEVALRDVNTKEQE